MEASAMEKKVLVEGIAIGAAAGVVATLLLAPKSGKETREGIKQYLGEIKDKVVAELAKAGDFTKEQYDGVVQAVVSEYEQAKKITVDEAKDIGLQLQDGFASVKDALCKRACPCEFVPV